MLKAAGREEEDWLSSDSIESFPCTDLRTIDQLWVKYSNGRFGFSVQKRIWESVGKDYEKFGDRVGWRKGMFFNKEWVYYNELTFSLQAPQGHLPAKVLYGGAWTGEEDVEEDVRYISSLASLYSRDKINISSLASRLVKCNI